MKIIEKGNTQYQCKCCGCKFEIESGDDIKYQLSSSLLWNNGYYYTRCPQCRSKVKLEHYNE